MEPLIDNGFCSYLFTYEKHTTINFELNLYTKFLIYIKFWCVHKHYSTLYIQLIKNKNYVSKSA